MNSIKEQIENFDDFPTLPTVYYKLVDALSDNTTTIRKISEIISTDIALSFKLLKIVNSSIYGLSTKVKTVEKAIFHMGFRELKNIILTSTVIDVFSDLKSSSSLDLVAFWKHSIAVGVVSRALANLHGKKNLDEYLLAGISHDIGKLVLYKILGNQYEAAFIFAKRNNIDLADAESKVFGINHLEIGYKIAKDWNLDDNIANSIKYHRKGLINSKLSHIVSTIHVANILTKGFEWGKSGNDTIEKPNNKIWLKYSLKEIEIKDFYNEVKEDYDQACEILIV